MCATTTIVAAVTAALFVGACVTPGRDGPTAPDATRDREAASDATATPPDAPYPDNERRVRFRCSNGESLLVRFFRAQGVAVLVRAGRNHELQQQVMASGFRYEGSGYRLDGKGEQVTLARDTGESLACTAIGEIS